MLESMKLEQRRGAIQVRMAELAIKAESLTDEERAEVPTLQTEFVDVETRFQAARVSEDVRTAVTVGEGETSEDREFRELRGKVSVSEYIKKGFEQRAVGGAESEFNSALKMGADQFPIRLLAPDGVEVRAKTDTDAGMTTPRRWLDRLFAISAATRLGISMESVGPGIASFPVTTAGATGKQRGRAQAADAAAWTVGITEMKPTAARTHGVFTVQDAARIGPGLEDALTRNLRDALMDSVDAAIFLGDSTANEDEGDIVGLNTAAITEFTLTQNNKVKGEEVLKSFLGLVDGKHAEGLRDLNVVLSVGANTLWGGTVLPSPVTTGQTIAQYLEMAGLSFGVRGDIETATSNGKFGGFVGRARGIEGAGVAAIWEAGSLIRDNVTGSKTGEIALTLNYLWAFGLPRPSNFQRLKFVSN